MNSPIIDGTNMDISVFSYSAPKANPSGGKVVNLYNKYFKESLTISTPLMLTWGAQEGMDQQKNPTGKFTMSLQFPSKDFPNEDADAFLAGMKALEQKVKQDAMTYSKEWFGKEIKSMDVMEEKFNIMLRHPKLEKGGAELDYNKPPTMTVKIPKWKGDVWQSEIYDEDGKPLFLKSMENPSATPVDLLKPKSQVICLLQCGGLWFVNGKVSITWNLKQAVVQNPKQPTVVEGTCFLKPKATDVEKLKTQKVSQEEVISSTIVDDSDDENELPPPVSQGLTRQLSEVEIESVVSTQDTDVDLDVDVETPAATTGTGKAKKGKAAKK